MDAALQNSGQKGDGRQMPDETPRFQRIVEGIKRQINDGSLPEHAARRAYDVLWRATQAGIDAARPGATCRDLFNAMSSVIAEIDDSGGDIGRLGHGLGMQLTEQPSQAAFDTTELKENMVLTIEPSLSYGDGLMMVHEENIVVADGQARLLTTRAAPELPVV